MTTASLGILVALLVIRLALVGSAIASESHSPTRVESRIELGADNVVSGDRPASIPVHLSEKAKIRNPLFAGSDMRATGAGRFVGFALMTRSDGYPRVWLGGRVPKSAGSEHFFLELGFGTAPQRSYTLPPGNYLLYLLPDGGASEVKFRLHGPSGSVSIFPVKDAAYQLKYPDEQVVATGTPGNQVRSAYSTAAIGWLGAEGVQFEATWFMADAHAATEADACFFKGKPPETTGDAPGCFALGLLGLYARDTGAEATIDHGVAASSVFKFFYGGRVYGRTDGYRAGSFSQTMSVETASFIREPDSLALWLTFD